MTDTRAEDALRQQSSMEAERANLDSHCQEVAERVLTRQRDFTTKGRIGGEKLNEKQFDSTAPLAIDRFGAAIESMLTPRTQRWHELTIKGAGKTKADDDVKQWLSQINEALFAARYAAGANFASQAHETYMGIGAFGNGAMFVDETPDKQGLRYKAIPFSESYWAENFQGIVDTVHRKFELTARQFVQKFGDECPETIRKAAETEPHRKFELIHCVRPREDADWSRMDYRGMKYASYYISFEGRKLLSESGYRTMRYACARYVTAPRETYGRGPAMTVLADIKTINEMQKTMLRTGQLAAEPPLLLSDDAGLGGVKLQPRALIRGGVDMDGRATVQPLQVGANMPITFEMMSQTRETINQAFLVTLFQILVETPQMTATEAMLRAQEKGALLAPTMGRLQSELLGPLIQAELDILSRQGWFDDLPEEMFADDLLNIEYTSPLARAQMADEGVGILRTMESIAPIIDLDPSTRNLFSGKGPAIARRLGEINGMSPDLMNTDDQIAALTQSDQQRQAVGDTLAGAEVASSAAANFAKAQSLAAGAPGQAAPQIIPEAA